MSTTGIFEQTCRELEETSSRTGKEILLKAACQDPTVEKLFVCAINPLVQFYTQVEEQSGCCEVSETFLFALLAALQLRVKGTAEQIRTGQLGKWLCRLINKKLSVGISVGALKKLLPGNSFALSALAFEKAELTTPEWFELLHHLEDSLKYLVQYELVGIRCIITIFNGQICPVAEVPLIRFEGFEEELVRMFPEGTVLEGRITADDIGLGDLYAWITGAQMKEGVATPELQFQILDIAGEGKFVERMKEISSSYNWSSTRVLFQEPQAICLDNLHQPKQAQASNCTLLLRHPAGERLPESIARHNLSVKVKL